MLINLVSNAIKFSHVGGMIFITVQTFRCNEKELEISISVKDQGIGMNAIDQQNLFKPYFKTTD